MNIEYIPIGMNCSVTMTLKNKKFRTQAYPFDWQVTSMQSFYNACSNNFKNLLDDIWVGEKIKRIYIAEHMQNPKILNDYIHPVICKKYNILFPHYFKEVDQRSINLVKDKMQKRIKSFRTSLKDNKIKKKFIYKFDKLNSWQQSCFKLCGVDTDIFSMKMNDMYLNKAIQLFSDRNVEFISLNKI